MNLKEIRVYGFKSFVDKTEIKFDRGITAIVGPNGCGKSNFSDAIRWVLGEARPSILRISNLAGLIFGGTDLRKPLSFCEVSVVFDNSTRLLPLPYEEVVITRKGYRSGTTEFLLNGERCRLQDIQEVLRDTGMGREGYSIIAQGKVAEIIQNHPKKRRAIFEEAAGIATYKKRKDDATNRLKSTIENIDKVNLLIKEIDKQLGPLKKQAEDARCARDLHEQQKYIEINQFIYQTENSNDICSASKQKIVELTEEIKHLETQIHEAEKKYNENTERQRILDIYISQLKDKQTEYLVDVETKKGEGKLNTEKISQSEKDVARLTNELENNIKQIDINTDKIAELKQKKELSNQELEKLKQEQKNLEDELDSVINEIAQFEINIADARDVQVKALALMSDIKANKSKYETEKRLLESDILDLKKKEEDNKQLLEEYQDEKIKLEDNYTAAIRTEENAIKLCKDLSDSVQELEYKRDSLIKELGSLEGDRTAKINYLDYMKKSREDYESYLVSVRNLMTEAKLNRELEDKIEGLVIELMEVPQDYEIAINSVLGNSLQNIVTRNEEDAKYIIRLMKEKRYGIVTILPISSYKYRKLGDEYYNYSNEKGVIGILSDLIKYDSRYDPIFIGLLGRTVLCDNLDNAVNLARKSHYSFRIVTLDGDIIANTGAMTGGRKNDSSNNLISADRKMQELQQALEKIDKIFKEKTIEKNNVISDLEIMKQEFTSSNETLNNKRLKLVEQGNLINKKDEDINRIDLTLAEIINNINSKEERLSVISLGIKEVEESENKISGDTTSSDAKSQEAQQQYAIRQNRKDELNIKIGDVKLQIKDIINDLNNMLEDEDDFSNENKDMLARNIVIKNELIQLDHNIKSIRDTLNKNMLTKEQKDEYEKINKDLEKYKEEKILISDTIQKILHTKDNSNAFIADKIEKKLKEENKLEQINIGMEQLSKHILEEYNLTYQTSLEYKRSDFNYEESSKIIANIKRELSKLGPINYQAIEQSQQAQERFDLYTKQVEDLTIAQGNLNQVIDELSESMLRRFNEEFTKINENFTEIFKELFGGGNAKLVIQEPEEGEDELSAGIEISAQPPGKKIQSITALSGGEQSMTAIAILFAILKVKAVPFCILDEIDAALDDSNVYLFANYLKKFSQDTQFIVITHRQPTMQAADVLNGVTMQERGVSRVVRVTISEAMKTLKEEEKIKG